MPFHIALYARHSRSQPGPEGTLTVPADAPVELLPVTFERAAAELSTWPRLFCEPDGSFVWVAEKDAAERWQLDGQLWDAGAGLAYVELNGTCPPAEFDRLATLLRGPGQLMVLLVTSGVLLTEPAFRARWLTPD